MIEAKVVADSTTVRVGDRFSRLTYLGTLNGLGQHAFRCECGELRHYFLGVVIAGRVKSCGCYNREKGRRPGSETAWRKWRRYLRNAAATRDIAFELTDEQVDSLCTRPCHYCGISPRPWAGAKGLYLASCKNKRTRIPDMAFAESKVISVNGIDRIDSMRGYTTDNCVPCCTPCNLAKLDRTVGEFKDWIARCYDHMWRSP